MRLDLTRFDDGYKLQRLASIGISCPYLFEFLIYKFRMTIYRSWSPTVCISYSLKFPETGGDMQDCFRWCLWQDNPWSRFEWYRRNAKCSEEANER